MITLHFRTSIGRSPLWLGFLLIPLVLGCFALSPTAHAVVPAPDGGYPNRNTAEGDVALSANTTGYYNTATGFGVLFSNTTGNNNTANGAYALFRNTTGANNAASGFAALYSNRTGSYNTANGEEALYSNTADYNTADGFRALFLNTTGRYNTATGFEALYSNIAGRSNTANGYAALVYNTAGNNNAASGFAALYHNTTGSNNTVNGANALLFNTTGSNNIALGFSAGADRTAGSNNIDIGNRGVAVESSHIRIGTRGTHSNTYIAGISGAVVAGGVGVIVDTNGHLGTVVSSERFKAQIKPMDNASEAILELKPVTFRYKKEIDPEGVPQFGLVAEDVEKVNRDLVMRDAEGKVYTVRYEAVNAMLLNEFLKEHHQVQEQGRKLEAQDRQIQEQRAMIAKQQEQIEGLNTGLQKVSAELEARKPAPQVVNNP